MVLLTILTICATGFADEWTVETLDSLDSPHIPYNRLQLEDRSIRYAWHDGSDWTTEVVIDWMY